jgi:RsiW-degrading membrane proteinase PrsW (M82 family)
MSVDARVRYQGLAIPAAIGGAIMVLLLGIIWLANVASSLPGYLLSLPTVVVGLWACRRIRTNQRPPWWLAALGVVWGGVVATGIASLINSVTRDVLGSYSFPGHTLITYALTPATMEELAKACGVLLLMAAFPRRLHGMMAGLVVGSTVGLGFQCVEAISYMRGEFATIVYQYWYRQSAGLLVGHAAYTALTGAAFGLASQQRTMLGRITCAVSGLLAAIATHFVWNTVASQGLLWTPADPSLYLFVALPVMLLRCKGPTLAAVAVLAITGNRKETRVIAAELAAEARSGSDAVRPDELAALATSASRRQARLRTLLSAGWDAYRRLARRHAAQVGLALTRAYRAEGVLALPADQEDRLRQAARGDVAVRQQIPPSQTERLPIAPAPYARPLVAGDPAAVGPYGLLGRLGSSVLGQVFLARSAAGQWLAVTVIHDHLAADPPFCERLAAGVEAVRRVDVAFAIPIVNADIGAAWGPWFATRLLPARPLARVVADGGAGPALVCQLAVRLAGTLEKLHVAGVVHGDLGPATVLIAADGPWLAEAAVGQSLPHSILTQSAAVAGTLGYLPPERLRGEPATAAGDVYAYGAVLFFAATGRDPRPGAGLVVCPRFGTAVPAPRSRLDIPGRRPHTPGMRALSRPAQPPPGSPDPPSQITDRPLARGWCGPRPAGRHTG